MTGRKPARVAALTAAVALLASACGSTARTPQAATAPVGQVLPAPAAGVSDGTAPASIPSSSAPASSAPGPSGAPASAPGTPSPAAAASSVSASPSTAPGGDANRPRKPAASKRPAAGGVLRLGILLDGDYLGQGLRDDYVPQEGVRLVEAIVDWVNDTGGVAGRRVDPVILTPAGHGDRGRNEQEHAQRCVEMTEDEQVFMVVSGVYSSVFAADCYAQHHTPLMQTSTLFQDEDYRRLAPWLIPMSDPTLTSVARLLPRALAAQGFFDSPSHKVGIMSWDAEHMMESAKNVLVPELKRRGANIAEVRFNRLENDAAWTARVASTVLDFQEQGINRVIFWDHGGGAQVFLPAAEEQGYRPRYGFSSLTLGDSRTANRMEIDPAQLRGAVGAGWGPGADIPDEVLPLTPGERDCLRAANERLGTSHDDRNPVDSGSAISAAAIASCEVAMLLRAALAPATGRPLAAADVYGLIQRLGDRHAPLTPPAPVFGPGLYGGGASYALIRYVEDRPGRPACRTRTNGCFRYVRKGTRSLWRPIPR